MYKLGYHKVPVFLKRSAGLFIGSAIPSRFLKSFARLGVVPVAKAPLTPAMLQAFFSCKAKFCKRDTCEGNLRRSSSVSLAVQLTLSKKPVIPDGWRAFYIEGP